MTRKPAKPATLVRKGARVLSFKPRNAVETKERILQAAIREFSSHGLMGARVERVVRASKVNMRMIYHYFGNKELLYIAALERVYRDVRLKEQSINLSHYSPRQGFERLIDFTFEHFANHPELINLVTSENLIKAKYLRRSKLIPSMNVDLQKLVRMLLDEGRKTGQFRSGIDPKQLWITLFSLCWTHVSNRHTLSWMFQEDLSERTWLDRRREHIKDVILDYIQVPELPAKH
ncbi:MAG: TetR/AcrR family transcriptional regulator [Parvibaculaceae bacterium]